MTAPREQLGLVQRLTVLKNGSVRVGIMPDRDIPPNEKPDAAGLF